MYTSQTQQPGLLSQLQGDFSPLHLFEMRLFVGEPNKGIVYGAGENVETRLVNSFGLFPCHPWQPLTGISGRLTGTGGRIRRNIQQGGAVLYEGRKGRKKLSSNLLLPTPHS